MKVTVKETQSNEVDWSKNPQLVVDEDGVIVKVLDIQEPTMPECFSGFCLNDDNYTGNSVHGWIKGRFKPFHGSITLSND